MLKKITAAAVLSAGLLMVGGTAFAENSLYTSDDANGQSYVTKHGTCTTLNGSRVCTNFRASN